MVLSLRKKVNIKVRQPLNKILIPLPDEDFKNKMEAIKHLVMAEVNVENIEYISNTEGLLKKKIKPNFKVLGAKVGGLMKQLTTEVNALNQHQIAQLEKDGSLALKLGDSEFDLLLSDVEILSEDIPGWQVTNLGRLTVALDTTITDDLRNKGIARELVNRIQNIRKDKGFEVTDKITVKIKGPDSIRLSVTSNLEYIRTEILATSLEMVDQMDENDSVSVEMDDEIKVLTSIKKN